MRTRFLALFVWAIPLLAYANPVSIDPSSLIAFGIVALAASVVFAGGKCLVLFRGRSRQRGSMGAALNVFTEAAIR